MVWAYSRDEPLPGIASRTLDGVEELAQVSLSMGLVAIPHKMLLMGENHVGEVVVLIDEEINLLSYLLAFLAKKSQLRHCILLVDHSFLGISRKNMCIDVTKKLNTRLQWLSSPSL